MLPHPGIHSDPFSTQALIPLSRIGSILQNPDTENKRQEKEHACKEWHPKFVDLESSHQPPAYRLDETRGKN